MGPGRPDPGAASGSATARLGEPGTGGCFVSIIGSEPMPSRFGHIAVVGMSILLWSILGAGCSVSSKEGGGSLASPAAPEKVTGPASDPKLVARYDSLATQIIDTRRKQVEVVRA